jgi:uncharacterized protein
MPVFAVAAGVKDDGGFFSKEAIEKANAEIKKIKDKYKKDVVIETYKAVPADKQDQLSRANKTQRNELFGNWVEERARQLELDGILVLITREPPHIQVGVGKNTRQKAFTVANRDELAKRMLARFRDNKYDDALVDGTSFIFTTIRGHTKFSENPDQTPAGAITDWKGWICPVLAIGAGIWLVFALIRAFSSRGGYAGAGAGAAPGGAWGGGGFMTGLLGGLFGAMAGNWIYNSFFGGHHGGGWGSSAHAGEPDHSADLGPDDHGEGFTSTGGDFGDSGGDAGGGDFGGGDFGGGGDY